VQINQKIMITLFSVVLCLQGCAVKKPVEVEATRMEIVPILVESITIQNPITLSMPAYICHTGDCG
jgi:hypothetical protein